MAMAKLLNEEKLNADLTAVANAIREKTGGAEALAFPEGFAQAIGGIQVSSGDERAAMDLFLTGKLIRYESDVTGAVVEYAFRNHKELKELILTKVTGTGTYMCYLCSALERAVLLSVRYLNNYAFQKCTSLAEITVPKVETLQRNCFDSCGALTSFDGPSSLWQINTQTFLNCSRLETLILRNPNRVVALVNADAFSGTPIVAGTGYVYVPRNLIPEYEADSVWQSYISQIRAIEDYPEICGGGA